MKNNIHSTKSTILQWNNIKLPLFFESILAGLFSGGIVVLYRYLLSQAEIIREIVYTRAKDGNVAAIALGFLFLLAAGFVVAFIIKKVPMVKGSGIPQVKGVLLRQFNMEWGKELAAKFIGGVLALGAGLSLGREGPSIQLGAHAGMGIGKLFKRPSVEQKYLITCGASAGLAAAFNAPLAGVMFSLEEMHKNFSPVILTSAMLSSLAADFVSRKFFGQQPVFNFTDVKALPLTYYIHLILLGVILGLFGVLFNKFLTLSQDLYEKLKFIKAQYRVFIPILTAGVLGFVLPEVLGGGHELIMTVGRENPGMLVLLILIIAKFLFTMMSYGSGAPGGIFLPLLVIGALTGKLYAIAGISFMGVDPQYSLNFVILAMAAYFTAIVKAPITGSILITEMTGSFSHLPGLMAISMTAYFTAELLKSKPVYDILLGRLLKSKGGSEFVGEEIKRVLLEAAVSINSEAEHRKVSELAWPQQCLLVSIKRGENEIIPNGDTVLYSGDFITMLTSEAGAAKAKRKLQKICMEKAR